MKLKEAFPSAYEEIGNIEINPHDPGFPFVVVQKFAETMKDNVDFSELSESNDYDYTDTEKRLFDIAVDHGLMSLVNGIYSLVEGMMNKAMLATMLGDAFNITDFKRYELLFGVKHLAGQYNERPTNPKGKAGERYAKVSKVVRDFKRR